MSIRDELLGLVSQKPTLVSVKFCGKDLFVREMTGAERDAFEADQVDAGKTGNALKNFRARLLVRVLVDEAGVRVFTDADADTVGNLPSREIRRVFDKAAKLNALDPDDVKELEKK